MVEGDDVATDDQEPTYGEVEQAIIGSCLPWSCNGPKLNATFHELSEMGLPNDEGFTLLGLYSAGLEYKVNVVGTQIKATRGLLTISGIGVKNKVMKVRHSSGAIYNLMIDDVLPSVSYWPNVPGTGTTWAYKITWNVVGGNPDQKTPICENAADFVGEYDTLGQPKWSVVLFEGDRWNAKTKQPKAASKEWFNIGCAGHVLGKLHITHHSFPGGLVPGYANTVDERQAMVNMYVANYCGDGTPFTIEGQPLSWSDSHIWSEHYYAPPIGLEARWGAHGPICLESPRLKGTVDPEAIAEFGPDIELAIEAHCPGRRPPTCSSLGQSLDPTMLEGAWFVSANP